MTRCLLLVVGAALALAPAASAHVTVQPDEAPAGGFVRLDVRVPNEQENAATVKVDLLLPPGFTEASYEPVPGWTAEVKTRKLPQPVQTDDGPVSEEVGEIVWTANGERSGIAPGQFVDFPLSVQIPDRAGDTLTFKALQTYSNGDVVRWIGPPGSDEPAPRVTVAAAATGDQQAAAAPAESSSDDSSTTEWLALGFGIAGLAAGLAALALVLARRRRSA
jgi:uncharacterized protein YcnI